MQLGIYVFLYNFVAAQTATKPGNEVMSVFGKKQPRAAESRKWPTTFSTCTKVPLLSAAEISIKEVYNLTCFS